MILPKLKIQTGAWEQWYAWYPVRVSGHMVWLENVLTRIGWDSRREYFSQRIEASQEYWGDWQDD